MEIQTHEVKLKNEKTLQIRNILPTDAEEFLNFRKQISTETTNTMHYDGMKLPSIEETQKRLETQSANKVILNIGVFDSKKIVGYINFRPFSADHPWTTHVGEFGMMILKEYWGNGIGKQLLNMMEIHARTLGMTRIEATVRAKNERAIQLYKHLGYRIEGTRINEAKINGEYQSGYSIAKILDDPLLNWRPPFLQTERLILRPIEILDAESIFAYASNPNVSRYTIWEHHKSIQDSLDLIKDFILLNYSQGLMDPLAITLKENPNKVIGTVGCFWVSKKNQTLELAYALAEEYWGQGMTVEASKKIIEYCVQEYKPKRIQSRCLAENTASARVMEKVGMTYEGTMKSSLFHRDKYWDMKYFGMVINEPLPTKSE